MGRDDHSDDPMSEEEEGCEPKTKAELDKIRLAQNAEIQEDMEGRVQKRLAFIQKQTDLLLHFDPKVPSCIPHARTPWFSPMLLCPLVLHSLNLLAFRRYHAISERWCNAPFTHPNFKSTRWLACQKCFRFTQINKILPS